MQKIELQIDEERCKSCGMCIAACPRKALRHSGRFNLQSYETVVVDPEQCIQCGICYTVCPDYVFELTEV